MKAIVLSPLQVEGFVKDVIFIMQKNYFGKSCKISDLLCEDTSAP